MFCLGRGRSSRRTYCLTFRAVWCTLGIRTRPHRKAFPWGRWVSCLCWLQRHAGTSCPQRIYLSESGELKVLVFHQAAWAYLISGRVGRRHALHIYLAAVLICEDPKSAVQISHIYKECAFRPLRSQIRASSLSRMSQCSPIMGNRIGVVFLLYRKWIQLRRSLPR